MWRSKCVPAGTTGNSCRSCQGSRGGQRGRDPDLSCPAAVAAKNATTTIPIVVTESGGDPVATGLVKSLSRPSGNVTGVSDMAIELAPKRLELLKDMVPTLRTVAMLWNVNDLGMTLRYQAAADAARTIGARVQPLGVRET